MDHVVHFEADAPRAASSLVAGRPCAFERKTHATDKLRFARVRLGSIFLNRSEARLCLFFFQFGVSEHPMFLCANQNHYATTFCIIVCDGVSKHFGPTSVPTYRSQMSRSFDSDSG